MSKAYDRKLILEDGSEYLGYGFGSVSEKKLELVFNTSMAGYQEILSDPSYTDQAVVMTYPLIGNYGMNEDDYETKVPTMGGFIVRDYNEEPSNFRCTYTLDEIMKQYDVAGISGVDTRRLARHIRDYGSCKVLLTAADVSSEQGAAQLRQWELPHDAVARVSCSQIWHTGSEQDTYHVVLIDCGMKQNILRSLLQRSCRVTVVPWNTNASQIKAFNPDGIMVSNGPGDPTDVMPVVQTIRELKGTCPIFGICLGHQLISLAYGAGTYKLKFGHRGGNHPVKDLQTGKIEITSQNHSYAVDADSLLGTGLKVTHTNLLDHTIEGLGCEKDHVFSVQYHPESAPGPQDSAYLFDRLIEMMKEGIQHA